MLWSSSKTTALVNTGKTVLLCWVHGHIGIKGNEQGDDVAKMALSSISAVKYPPSDLYHDVIALCYKLWQADCDQRTGNNLHSVKPHLRYYSVSSLNCQDAVVPETNELPASLWQPRAGLSILDSDLPMHASSVFFHKFTTLIIHNSFTLSLPAQNLPLSHPSLGYDEQRCWANCSRN